MKKSKIAFIGIVFSVLLTGCMTSSEPYSFPISNVESKTFNFSKVDSSNVKELSANDVLSAVKSYIRDNGAFYKCQSSSFFSKGGCYDSNGSSGLSERWGSEVSRVDGKFVLTYFKTATYSTGREDKATTVQTFPYELTENDEQFSVTLFPPKTASVTPDTNAVGLTMSPPIRDENVLIWTQRILDKDKTVDIDKFSYLDGEFDVALDPQSVKANLIREFGLTFREKENGVQWVSESKVLYMDNTSVSISVTLNLYRGESKVEYSLRSPHSLRSNGKVLGFSDEIFTKALADLKASSNA